MQKHTKVYMKFFRYGIDDLMPCEVTWFEMKELGHFAIDRAVDIHHIDGRGKGKDVIENLIGVSRENHDRCHGIKQPVISKEKQREIHLKFMEVFK